jgi:RHS repeat-associated protein
VSNTYTSAQQACVQGWSDIAASQSNGAGVTASWNGSVCKLSNGQILPVLSNQPHSNPAVDPNAFYAVSVLRPNGAEYWFFCQNVTCNATSGVALQLTVQNGGGFQFTNEDGSVENYTSGGQIQSISSLGGYTQNFSYANGQLSSVTDSFGRNLVFSYNANGPLASISTPDGVTQYAYNNLNLLTAVIHPDQSVRQYQYNNVAFPTALTGVLDENGAAYASISYDIAGRAVQSSSGNGAWQSSVDYTTPLAPIVTDAFGVSRTYQYAAVNGQAKLASISGQSCNTCDAPATATYDLLGYYSFVTDWNGNTTLHVNEPSGLEEALVEAWGTPLQRTTFKQWNEVLRLPTEIDEPGRSTTFNYDGVGNLSSKTITDINSGATRTISYGGYTPFGQPLTVTGPRTDVVQVTQYAYYPIVAGDPKSGMLSQITDALGHVSTFNNYNASGHPTQITDPNGLVTLMAYDVQGRLLSSQAGTELTQHSYDGAGQLIETQLPNSAFLKYSYNAAHQLVGVLDQIGNRIVFSPDAMGNNISERTYNAAGALVRTHSRLYNSFNQLIQDVGAQNQVTTYQNDNNGNRTRTTSPLGFQSSSAYDALNRLSSIADPTSGITQYTYTALDQIAAVADPRTLVTTYLNDAFGNPTQLTSPDSGLTVKTFDAAGNVTTQTDNKGQLTSFSYDALNRVTQITRADQSTVIFSYDQGANGIGHLTAMVDASGSTNWSYDQHGRVTQKASVVGSTTLSTQYGYDAAGRLISMTMPSGKQVSYTWSNGQIVSLALKRKPNGASATLVSNIVYFPFGNPMSWTLGNGEVVSRVIDLEGRITTDDVEFITYDSDSRIVTRALGGISALSDTQSLGYDASNRLTSYSDSNESVSYQYDLSGNRIQQVTGTHEIAYAIDPASNRILSSQKARVSGGNSASVRENVVVPAIVIVGGPPPVTISINPTSIILSEQATLTWTSPGADSCTASGDWSGLEQTTGSTVEMPITAGTFTYTLTCSNSGGSTTSSAALTVNAPAAGETIFNYDLNGSLKNDGVFNYSYDAANRLNQAEKIPAGTATPTALSSYVANGLNQRVMMMTGTTAPVTTSLLSYDEAGHLIGHYANVAKVADATETVWLGDMPVAIVKPANTFYIHSDYLNTPRQISDASRDPVWAWEPQNFGANAPNTDPTNSGTNFSYILRFPGQFADQEPGLRYNYARDYDPKIGRYIESDPIGLSGGINPYAYVGENPISNVDPTGLLCFNFDQFANDIEQNRFDLGATAATLGLTLGIGTMPKVPSELRGLGVAQSDLNPYTSQLSRLAGRLGIRGLRDIGRTTAGVAASTAATLATVFEGFYDLSVEAQAAVNATSSGDCGCQK